MQNDYILLGHGAGGKLSHQLIEDIFVKHFNNKALNQLADASILDTTNKTAFSTDSYVIDPIFFPGGDIGKLAISGTVNDLLVGGAIPQYLSAGFILEEGFSIQELDQIAASMAKDAKKANVSIVTGDTKVVKKGQCDKIFINTAGIGMANNHVAHLWEGSKLVPGDKVIVSGYLGDHAICILGARNNIQFEHEILSDATPLNNMILPLLEEYGTSVKFMRDITRGGLATILNEVCNKSIGIRLNEADLPIRKEVLGTCEIFGYDPLYLANEGKAMFIVEENAANAVLNNLKESTDGKDACIVGEICSDHKGKVAIKSLIGGNRIVDMLSGEMLPRIC